MKILHTLVFCLIISSVFATTVSEKEIDSKVKEVTVFLQGAHVMRNKTVAVGAGTTILKFSNLSPYIDAKSIQVKSKGDIMVVSISHQKNFHSHVSNTDEVLTIRQQIKTIDNKLEVESAYQSIIKEELEFLRENRNVRGEDSNIDITHLQQASEYYGKRLTELKLDDIKRNRTIQSLNAERNALQMQINNLSGIKKDPTGEVFVKVRAKKAVTASFEVSYLVSNAGWFPTYDIRAKSIDQPIQLIYKANVYQNTLVEWKDVKLTFSSSDPNAGGVAPVLKKYQLAYGMLAPNYSSSINQVVGRVTDESNLPLPGCNVVVKGTTIGTVTDASGYYSLTVPDNHSVLVYSFIGMNRKALSISGKQMNVRLEANTVALDEVVLVGYGSSNKESVVNRSKSRMKKDKLKIQGGSSLSIPIESIHHQTRVEFQIETPYSIKSNNESYVVDMIAYEMPSNYEYYSIPKVDQDAFLMAQITDWQKYNLLEGEANIFFEDTYIGKSILNVTNQSDTLELSLGRDKQVMVRREKIKDHSTKQFVGGKKEVSRAWKTVIRNNKQQSISLKLFDQVPVSLMEEIEVKVDELSKGELNKENGEVIWSLQLTSAEQVELELMYSVKYPKNKVLLVE